MIAFVHALHVFTHSLSEFDILNMCSLTTECILVLTDEDRPSHHPKQQLQSCKDALLA